MVIRGRWQEPERWATQKVVTRTTKRIAMAWHAVKHKYRITYHNTVIII